MRNFRENMSITKLVLLLIVLTLMFIEIWNTVRGGDISDLFSNVVIAIVSFYFGQKGIEYKDVDSLIEKKKDLDNNPIL